MTANTAGAPATALVLATARLSDSVLFHFLFLSAGLADIKVLASKICLC